MHGFSIVERASGAVVGSCGFQGPPGPDGGVEIAYAVNSSHQRHGYVTEAAAALAAFAFRDDAVRLVRAHTLPVHSPSPRVLAKCSFSFVGDVVDAGDGPVWRWERTRTASVPFGP